MSMAGLTGLRYNFNRTDQQQSVASDTPLFERQMSNDEYSEYQQLRAIIDNLHQRISKLEKINTDLEGRLEEQAKQSMAVETDLIQMERAWKQKCEQLSQEIGKWRGEYDTEKVKNNRLRDHLSNTERELYIILQRKHELMRGGGPGFSMKGGGAGAGGNPTNRIPNSESGILTKRVEIINGEPSEADLYSMQRVREVLLDSVFFLPYLYLSLIFPIFSINSSQSKRNQRLYEKRKQLLICRIF
jgi:hypothetical protein